MLKNLILLSSILALVSCSADLVVEKGQYGSYCNVDESGRLIVTIANIGTETAKESTTLVNFGKYGLENVPTPALDKGEIVVLSPVYIPRGCYDSDCSFDITVDIENVVSEGESGEANNKVIGTCIG